MNENSSQTVKELTEEEVAIEVAEVEEVIEDIVIEEVTTEEVVEVLEEVNDIQQALPDDMEASLPSWWTNKLAVSSAYLNSLRDYIVYSNSETTTLSQKECEVEIKLDATEER